MTTEEKRSGAHTPGPYTADCLDTFGYKPRVFGDTENFGGKLIAEIGNAEDPQYSQDEWTANAARIAAMFAFCEGVPTEQLQAGSLGELVDAAAQYRTAELDYVGASYSNDADIVDDAVVSVAQTARQINKVLAPFKGGNDEA